MPAFKVCGLLSCCPHYVSAWRMPPLHQLQHLGPPVFPPFSSRLNGFPMFNLNLQLNREFQQGRVGSLRVKFSIMVCRGLIMCHTYAWVHWQRWSVVQPCNSCPAKMTFPQLPEVVIYTWNRGGVGPSRIWVFMLLLHILLHALVPLLLPHKTVASVLIMTCKRNPHPGPKPLCLLQEQTGLYLALI